MNKSKEKQLDIDLTGPQPSTMDLRGKQSVRATFRLSEACIDAISILATQLGIKQKSVFDHLMEDAQTLKSVARELQDTEYDRPNRIQKTFVISRISLSFLDMVSSLKNAPRDDLVEFSVRRLLPIISSERKKHVKRKKLLPEISDHFIKGEKMLSKARSVLGTDDPIVGKLQTAMAAYKNAYEEIDNLIEKGKNIEKFTLEPNKSGY